MIPGALLAVVVALQSSLPATPSAPPNSRTDSLTVVRAMAAARNFMDVWQGAWSRAEVNRAIEYAQVPIRPAMPGMFERMEKGGNYNPRMADLNCNYHWNMPISYVPDNAWGIDPGQRRIGSKGNDYHSVCPNWLPPDGFFVDSPRPPDERLGIDGALEIADRLRLGEMRRPLINQLAAALRGVPDNALLVGQLVRFLVDDGNLPRAWGTAHDCAAEKWWCRMLEGYVHHRAGRIAAADSLFAQGVAAMPKTIRCDWADVSLILDPNTNFDYTRRSCTQRDSLTNVIWWLADPLWSVPGNDRRTEHYARRMTVALHAATGRDERYNWTPEGGGDALAEMVTRYGWPSYAYAGTSPPRVYFGPPKPPTYGYSLLYKPAPKTAPLVTAEMKSRMLGGLKTTFEYRVGRVHVMPPWSMLAHPFDIALNDWSVNAPGGDGDLTLKWWPREHYAPVYPLVAITDQQTAFLRRDDHTLCAYATNLGQTDLARRMGDSVDAVFVVSKGPNNIVIAARTRVEAHDRLTFLARVPSGPTMISAEVMWDAAGHRGARARFGATPAPPLSAMRSGEVAISDPVLLVVPVDVTELPVLADSAIALMRGSSTMSTGTNAIGVYWETYGFAASDSVEMSVSVQRHSGNVLGRIVTAAGITGDANAAVVVSWKEPQPGHTTRTIGGRVPVQMRSVVLKIPALPPGDYALEVSARKPGGESVTGHREFVLR